MLKLDLTTLICDYHDFKYFSHNDTPSPTESRFTMETGTLQLAAYAYQLVPTTSVTHGHSALRANISLTVFTVPSSE